MNDTFCDACCVQVTVQRRADKGPKESTKATPLLFCTPAGDDRCNDDEPGANALRSQLRDHLASRTLSRLTAGPAGSKGAACDGLEHICQHGKTKVHCRECRDGQFTNGVFTHDVHGHALCQHGRQEQGMEYGCSQIPSLNKHRHMCEEKCAAPGSQTAKQAIERRPPRLDVLADSRPPIRRSPRGLSVVQLLS